MRHIYADAFKCHKWSEGSECLCPAWHSGLIQEGAAGEPAKIVGGCLFRLMPWMISGAIRQSNIAAAEASASRRDISNGLALLMAAMAPMAAPPSMSGAAVTPVPALAPASSPALSSANGEANGDG